jgi:hypothetical protein
MTRAVLAILLGLAACRGAEVDAPADNGVAVEASQPAGASAEVRQRVLEARLLGRPIGTFAIERTPAGSGERWTLHMTMTLQLDDPGENGSTIESEEVIEYDAKGELVRSHEVSREQGVEETNEIVREVDRIRDKKTGPSFEETKTFELPADARSELAVYRELVAEAQAGKALPLVRTYSSFDESRMKFRPTKLTLQGRASVRIADEDVGGWAVVSQDDEGERTKAVFDETGMPLQLETGVFSAVPAGTPAAKTTARLSSMLAVKGNFDSRAKTVTIDVAVAEDEADLPPVFPAGPYQTVTRKGGAYSLELKSMACDSKCDGLSLPLSIPRDVAPFAAPTSTSQSDDAGIVAKAKAITKGRKDARAVAEAIVTWSFETLEKRDGTRGAATAVETLWENGGDCTEHTALTVALLRAAGIPARNTAGIVLLPGFFTADAGYHAWVEVWLGEWVVMDPALGKLSPGPHYIRLGHEEPGMDDGSAALSRLLGRTTITFR